jgi:small subunit ribosomal protein S15
MAKMHTKKKGKSKSRKPITEKGKIPEGLELSAKQIEGMIVDYYKQGMRPAMIGETLKREHNVLDVEQVTGKRLVRILKEQGQTGPVPPDLLDLIAKAVNLNKHIGRNKRDTSNTIRLKRIESKIWRLTKYYIRQGALPSTWRYDPKSAELLIRGRA